jgi:4-carboxymuconolactone decarboxylase
MPDGNGNYDRGLAKRKQVLGDDHVQRSLDQASEFTRPMQELATGYCWGEIWTRDGLDSRERSLINLGMLTALNRSHELAVHVRGYLHNACATAERQEDVRPARRTRGRCRRSTGGCRRSVPTLRSTPA